MLCPPSVVTLSKVEVHVAEADSRKDGDPNDASIDKDDRWESVELAQREHDFLKLQNDTTAALGELHLPEGKITQIRLFVDESGRN